LVKYEGKPLIEPPHGIERRQSGLDICGTRPRWDEAQIDCTYTAYGQHIVSGRGINYRHCKTVPPEVEEGALNFYSGAGTLDARFRIGATLAPFPDRALGVGFDHPDTLAIIHRRNCEPNSKCALAATALLGCQHDCVHLRRPSMANRGALNNFECASEDDQRVLDSSQVNKATLHYLI
jgi:hypothetical protein